MNEEILNEIVEETTEIEEIIEEEVITIQQREHPFCVISKGTFGQYNVRDIQTNSSWNKNPYGDEYAVVPDSMVADIMATSGFCDIELNEDGTEVVSFTALPIPEIEPTETEPTPSVDERITELEEQLALQDELSIELYENQIAQEETNALQDEALIELYEMVGGE